MTFLGFFDAWEALLLTGIGLSINAKITTGVHLAKRIESSVPPQKNLQSRIMCRKYYTTHAIKVTKKSRSMKYCGSIVRIIVVETFYSIIKLKQ